MYIIGSAVVGQEGRVLGSATQTQAAVASPPTPQYSNRKEALKIGIICPM